MTPGTEPTAADHVQSSISRYWGRHAESYHEYQISRLGHRGVRTAWADLWTQALPAPPSEILDAGTGTGHVSLLLAGLGHRVTGIDLAEGMLEQARRAAEGMVTPPTLQLGDAVTPDFPPGSFDAVTSRYVLWTLREPTLALANWRTLLRPGGRLVAVDSTWHAGGIHAGVRRSPAPSRRTSARATTTA